MIKRFRKSVNSKESADNLFQVYLISHRKLVYWTSVFYFIVFVEFFVMKLDSINQYTNYIEFIRLKDKIEFIENLLNKHDVSQSNRIRKFNLATIETRKSSTNWEIEKGDIENTIKNIRKIYSILLTQNLFLEIEFHLGQMDSVINLYDQKISNAERAATSKSESDSILELYISEMNPLLDSIKKSNVSIIADKKFRKYFSESDLEKPLNEILRLTNSELESLEYNSEESIVNIPTVNIPIPNRLASVFTFVAIYFLSLFLPLLHSNYNFYEKLFRTKTKAKHLVPSLKNILLRINHSSKFFFAFTKIIGIIVMRILPVIITALFGIVQYYSFLKLPVLISLVAYFFVLLFINWRCVRSLR